MQFNELGLCDALLKAVAEQSYTTASPIQAKAIPPILAGKDVMAAAQTGTGKTAGFTLPILQRLQDGAPAKPNQVRALILTPTRELAAQVADNVANYSRHLSLRSAVVFGGVKINPQMQRLRGGVDVLVATPGRLLDLYQQNAIRFDRLEVLVLDEADRMLDMGFIHDIRRIIKVLPQERQNLMFSATFSDSIRKLAAGIVRSPVEVAVSPPNTTVEAVKQWLVPVDKKRKSALLHTMIKDNDWRQVLVFSRTKHGANKLVKILLDKGIKSAAIHGNKSQGARTRALAEFKSGDIDVLVATDIAARGLDISQLPHVINFDLPNVPEDYVHRIGRTGRAGASGEAVSFVSADELQQLRDIERLIGQLIERQAIDGFEPDEPVPVTELNTKPFKAKRAKKPKSYDGGANQSRSNQNRSGNSQAKSDANGDKPANKPRRRNNRSNNSSTGANAGGGKPQARRSR